MQDTDALVAWRYDRGGVLSLANGPHMLDHPSYKTSKQETHT
jgi:hypothetical protein